MKKTGIIGLLLIVMLAIVLNCAAMEEPDHQIIVIGQNGVYDLNTVVNYCPDTLSLLDSPPYSAFRRDENGEWINISYDVDWRYWA